MEPDFSSLAERKNSYPVTGVTKPCQTIMARGGSDLSAMPAVHFGLQSQTCFVNKQENSNTMQSSLQTASLQHAAQQFSSRGEKPGLQMNFRAGPSATLTHAPVPLRSNSLPQSQPPVVHTCQSLSASVPSTIQVPVTPGYNPVQMATVVNFGLEPMCSISTKDQKPKKQGKYVCEYCSRACAKPSVLLKHIRSHTGERPYPCVTCGFSFKTKSNLYKHKKSHAHAIKLGLVARSDSGTGSLSVESDKALGTHSDVEESGDSDEESSTADLDPDSSQSSVAAFSESSLQSIGTTQGNHGDAGDPSAVYEMLKPTTSQRGYDSKGTANLPKVVVYPVNVSPLRADSPRVSDSTPEQATAQRQRDFQTAHIRSSITVLSSLKEVDCTSPLQDAVSEDEDQQCRSPPGGGHGQLQRQQATDFSQQQQGKCLLSPRSLGSTDSGYFSRSESADQAMSPPSPFVKITPPTDMDVTKNVLPNLPAGVATVMHVASVEKSHVVQGQMRPPLETKALSLEERISKLISDNEAVVDDKQLDSVKPRRTSLSRRGSIDSPKSYIFKDSFQFDLKPMARRSSSSSDIPKSPFTPTEKNKPVFLLSVPNQFSPMDCLPITRSNSMPTTPGHTGFPPTITQQPHPLRSCQSFDDKVGSLNDDVFSSAPSTPNPAIHSRTLVRQVAVEDFSTSEGLTSVRSMDEGYQGSRVSTEIIQRSRSFEHAQDRNRKPQQSKGTMYECETCRNRYRKLENFENHKKFYCSELHGPKNLKPVSARETEQDVFTLGMVHPFIPRITSISGIMDQQQSIRKRRKMKSVGDDDDQSPTDTNPPCSVSFDSCQLSTANSGRSFSQHSGVVDLQPKSNPPQIPQIPLVARGTDVTESRLSPIRETHVNTCSKERSDLQRQSSGTSVIKHTNSLSRPNSFETSESIDRASPIDYMDKDSHRTGKSKADATANLSLERYHEKMSIPKCAEQGKQGMENCVDRTLPTVADSCAPVQQSRLVRQNNIPEILVTEEPDREHDSQSTEQVEKPADTFNWPQRSESLSKLPTEKLPPKKKRIRLAQMEQSSGDSSFESSLSRSLSRDSSLSRCSSISASFDRDEPSRSESPSRGECVNKIAEPQGLPLVFNTLGVPGIMRRAASEQISCTQPSVEISCDYRSKSFDCGVSSIRSMSPNRSMSPMDLPKSAQVSPSVHVPLIERRRGPLVRQMSLKIGPESQQNIGKHAMPLQRLPAVFSTSQQIQQIANKPPNAQPFILHSRETLLQKNEKMVQSINLGSQSQQPQVHGLPHPWHQTSRVQTCQKLQQPLVNVMVNQEEAAQNKSADSQDKKSFVPKYQMPCSVVRLSQTYTFSSTQATQTILPVLTIPIANQIQSVSKPSDCLHNVYVAQQCQQTVENKTHPIVLPIGLQNHPPSQTQPGAPRLPQILITHEQMHPSHSVASTDSLSNLHVVDTDSKASPDMNKDRPSASAGLQVKHCLVSNTQNPTCETQRASSLGSLHCTQKMAAVTLCPQPEPIASSKRMLSPANSLDIAMEKHQKRAKDEHGAACLTDGRSVNYLNSQMAEVTRQRKLMLVRQVCTTEPVDSPIETEAPQLEHDKPEGGKDSQTPENCKTKTPERTRQDEQYTTVPQEQPSSGLNTNQGSHVSSVSPSATLKPQDKTEEQRLAPTKSPIRPLTFHGQVKLASSVSVVNTRDSHRLSFPSLKTATTFTWCYLMKRKPLHVPQTDQKISAYSTWAVSLKNPNPLGLPTKVAMSLFDSKQKSKTIHYTEAITTSMKSDILAYSSKLKDVMPKVLKPQKSLTTENNSKVQPETQTNSESDKDVPPSSKLEPRRVKIFDGGFKSNEDYVYVRGRGRGKYICEECGIRCKKPSMLRKHIRTHSDVRPYHCTHCNFSFKTKGNLTKHMKSKAHSKKCLEMGVSVGLEDQDAEDSDRSQVGSADHPDSDGEDSEGADDDNEDDNDEEEEDSLSGLSTNPSVSASPLHIPSSLQTELPPSSLLAQMSIHHHHQAAPLPHPQASESQAHHAAVDTESVPMLSPVSLVKQMSISGSCTSPGPMPYSPPPHALTSDHHASDTESVHMMSPVSPCRQMSIDYPDFDVPSSPPTPGKGCSKLGQDGSLTLHPMPVSEPCVPVGTDVSTQTASLAPQTSSYGPLDFPSRGLTQGPGSTQGGHTHLFSHLPLHSQQPSQSPYSMVPVGGIQLVPAGLAAYSTFVPIQAGPVQLTIPAVSVIHRNTSPLPFPSSPQPEGSSSSPTTQPLVVQESISNVMPCFPLRQVTGLQAVGASHQTLQSIGLETLNVMGLASSGGLSSTQLLSQHGLTLNATLGLQVLATSPTSQSSTGPHHTHIPGLQILNIALSPALIPALSPVAGPTEREASPEAPGALQHASRTEPGPSVSCPSAASSPTSTTTTVTGSPAQEVTPSGRLGPRSSVGSDQTAEEEVRATTSLQPSPSGPPPAPGVGVEGAKNPPTGGASEPVRGGAPQRQSMVSRQKGTQDYSDESASSDDEGRLVIAT